MKFINLFLITLPLISLDAQVNVKGAETTKVISNQREVVFERKEIDVTKYVEESPSERVVIINDVKGAEVVESSDGAVKIKISPRGAEAGIDKDGENTSADAPREKKRIVIDLGEPKTVQRANTENEVDSLINEAETKLAEADSELAEAEKKAKEAEEKLKLTEERKQKEKAEEVEVNLTTTQNKANLVEENNKLAEVKPDSTEKPSPNTTKKTNTINKVEEPYQDIFEASTNEFALNDSSKLKKKNYDHQYNYENYIESFPPRKKAKWTIGIHGGIPLITGDIRSRLASNMGGGLNIEKPFTPLFALRLQSIFAQMYGYHHSPRPLVLGGDFIYPNYKTRMIDNSFQAVFRVNNFNFHKRNPKVLFKLILGGGAATSFTQQNLLDENGVPYDYSEIANVETFSDRKFVANQLNNLVSDNFETVVEPTSSEASLNSTRILPSIMFGTGLDFYLSKAVDLSLEGRISRHFTDNLDGLISGTGEDWFVYLSAGLNFKLGKDRESIQWENPLASSYDDLMALKQNQDLEYVFQDLDNDGVADYIDQDLNTPPGVKVDTKGVPSDSDGDGIADYLDKDPFTSKNAEVDEFGVALDSDGDGVSDSYDVEPNTPKDAQTDVSGREIKSGVADAGAINNWAIFFDTDSYRIKDDYNVVVNNVATYLAENPNVKLKLVGYADTRYTAEYNLQLSNRRVNEVANRLKALGINESRIQTDAKGDSKVIVDVDSKASLMHQLNRRVTITFLD